MVRLIDAVGPANPVCKLMGEMNEHPVRRGVRLDFGIAPR